MKILSEYGKKFLIVKHPTELHDCNDIFYVIMSTILLHNMMVEVCMEQGGVESSDFYIMETITNDKLL